MWLKQVPVGTEVIIMEKYKKEVGEFTNTLIIHELHLDETVVINEANKMKYKIPTKYLEIKH